MKRGDLVTVAAQGDYGKPRPAVVIQSDSLDAADSVLVALLSSTLADAPLYRLTLEPTAGNGLRAVSQVMVDKVVTVSRERIGERMGCLDEGTLIEVTRALAVFLGFA